MPFGVTPLAGFADQAPTEFPRFIQFQQDGVDLGDNAVEIVNFVRNLTATRGTGESIGTLEVSSAANIQLQNQGVDLGDPDATTIDFSTNLVAVRVGDTVTVVAQSVAIPPFTWNEQAGDYRLQATDAEMGIATTGTTGMQVITIPDDIELAVPIGTSIVIEQDGAATVTLATVSGVSLHQRDAFFAVSAGQYSVMTLLKRAANTWVLCGDMEQA